MAGWTTAGRLGLLSGLDALPTTLQQLWLALTTATTADPGVYGAGSLTELAIANYARQPAGWQYNTGGWYENDADVLFPNLGAGSFKSFALVADASVAADATNIWFAYDNAVTVASWSTGDTLRFPQGSIRLVP